MKKLNIAGIRPSLEGVYVTVSCRSCTEKFERFLPTVSGLAFGRFACPKCHSIQEILPDDFVNALQHFFPNKTLEELSHLNCEANRIAESWYLTDSIARLLSYRDQNLGEPTERALFSCISLGLYLDNSIENGGNK